MSPMIFSTRIFTDPAITPNTCLLMEPQCHGGEVEEEAKA